MSDNITACQLAKGNNGIVKAKYITFSVEAENIKAARARLARIETDILSGKLSNESPIGKALCGRKAGETATVYMPKGGSYQIEIVSVEVNK